MENKQLYSQVTVFLAAKSSHTQSSLTEHDIAAFIDNRADPELRKKILSELAGNPALLHEVVANWQMNRETTSPPAIQRSTNGLISWLTRLVPITGIAAVGYLSFTMLMPPKHEQLQANLRGNYPFIVTHDVTRGDTNQFVLDPQLKGKTAAFVTGENIAYNRIHGIDTVVPDATCDAGSDCELLKYYQLAGEWIYMINYQCASDLAVDIEFEQSMRAVLEPLVIALNQSGEAIAAEILITDSDLCSQADRLSAYFN